MRKIALSIAALGLAFTPLVFADPAHAQVTRTWVSGAGDDSNPCSRTAPCKTYAAAISLTATGGEINCLDPGGFGALTITKSISVVCDYTEGGVLAAAAIGFIVDAPAGSIVTLKGQDIECFGSGINGIEMRNVAVTLHVHKTQIRNCRGANGILIAPSSGLARVLIADSYITDNGADISSAGLLIKPTGGASANVSVNRVQFETNTNGILMDGSTGSGPCNLSVKDSIMSAGANNGVAIASTASAMTGTVTDSTMSFNFGAGAAATGAQATLRLGSNTISNNVTGVNISGGIVQSFKNNMIVGNLVADGTPLIAVNSGGLILN